MKMFVENIIYYSLWLIVLVFSGILRILIKISELDDLVRNVDIGNRFDYVIVGGGSAGAILAARLSEESNISVLLIEAGGEGFDLLNIPVVGPMKQLTDLDWQHSTVPQKYSCLGLENNSSKWPSGKILGGSTHLNYMIYLKGHKNDYLSWKDPNSSHWGFDDINYYFNKGLECVQATQSGICHKPKSGSISVRKPAYTTKLSETMLKSALELGYTVNDINENGTGFMTPLLNLNEFGKRWTSSQYLKSVGNKNLKVLTNAIAEEILFINNYEAYGVRYRKGGKSHTVYANVEIILSSGTIGSAKLLMLSGIGPESVLKQSKIRSKIDLPVGKNLQDHVTTGLDLVIVKKELFSFADLLVPSSAYQYFVHGTGPFTTGLVEAVGVIHSSLVNPLRESPDLEFMVLMAGLSSDKGIFLRDSMGISKKVWESYFKPLVNESVVTILPVLLHPKSVGEVSLNPINPNGKPIIDPKYLSNPDDVRTLIEGIRIVRRLVGTRAMATELGARFNEMKFPGCESHDFHSDDYWSCYVRHVTLSVYHPVGTCKMAGLEEGGVVDHRLRVHKTNKLRVIDASIMPTLPSANTNAAVVMIAEKGADLIKEDLKKRFSTCQPREIFFSSAIISAF